MRINKKYCLFILVIFITLTNTLNCFAKELMFLDEANSLYKIGIFTDPYHGEKVKGQERLDLFLQKNLNSSLSRQDAIVLCIQLLGKTKEKDVINNEDASRILNVFSDKQKIYGYANKAFAWAVKNNLISGKVKAKGDERYIAPQDKITGNEFSSIIIKYLGYTDINYKRAAAYLAGIDGSTYDYDVASEAADKYLTRNDAFGIMYGSLTCIFLDKDESLIERLVNDGVIDRFKAM